MRVDLRSFELHNIVKDGDGLRLRKTLRPHAQPVSGVFIGGFTVESPFTTEPWHYLFEYVAGLVTLRVYTEEYLEMFNYPLGVMQPDAVITWGVQNNQLMINSPSFSTPLYGVVGGGLVTAVKTASNNPDTTALEIPNGHICSFGDRFVIAQGNNFYVNDPPSANGVDPRTFTDLGRVSLPGSILDIFQGPDGALYVFTTAGVFSMAQDAIGQGQSVAGFISRIPGIETSRSRNACASTGFVAVLQRDHLVLLAGGAQKRIDLTRYNGRRSFSQVVDVDDLRLSAELYATPHGFLIGFRGKRGFFIVVDADASGELAFSYVTTTGTGFSLVGVCKTRDGEAIPVLADQSAVFWGTGGSDYDGNIPVGAACGRVDLAGTRGLIRRVIIEAANVNQATGAYVSGSSHTKTTPSLTLPAAEAVIGTAVWGAGTAIAGRELRSIRNSYATRHSEPHIEVVVNGADRKIGAFLDVEVSGQGREREDKD